MNKQIELNIDSFEMIGGNLKFPNLEKGSFVCASAREIRGEYAFDEANDKLREEAQRKNYTHVLGIFYQIEEDRGIFECRAIGTGYKPKNN